jgi:hypothetical protein
VPQDATASAPEQSPPDDPATSPSAETTPEQVATECVDGEWRADLDDLAEQFARQLSATGMTVSAAEASGQQDLSIAREGHLGFATEMTFTLTVDSSGLAMTIIQTHTGSLAADWQWTSPTPDGGTMDFSRFNDEGYAITNTVEIAGEAVTMPFDPPSAAAGNVPMVVTCTGDSLTTSPQGSPFTTRWTRVG